jgi:hypothetical protein
MRKQERTRTQHQKASSKQARDQLLTAWNSLKGSLGVAFAAWLAARVVTIIGGWYGVAVIPQPGTQTTQPESFGIFNSFYCWDSGWYKSVIEGYSWNGDTSVQQNVAFFPFYPIVVKLFTMIFPVNVELAQLLVSQISFYSALVVIHLISKRLIGPEAIYPVFFCALYPGAEFYFMGYSEGLFLLLTALTFYWVYNERWTSAGISAYLSALTRSLGFLLVVPLAYEYWLYIRRRRQRIGLESLAVIAPLLGLATYGFFLYVRFGDFLAWSKAQLAWRPHPTFFVFTIARELQYAMHQPYWKLLPIFESNYSPTTLYFDLLCFFLISLFVGMGHKKIPLSMILWTCILLIVPLQTGQSWNMVRFSAVAFPAFIALGGWCQERKAAAATWIATSTALLFAATAYTLSNRYIC